MLKLKLQYFGHLMHGVDSLEKPWCWERLRVGGEGDKEDEMVRWHYQLDGHGFGWTPWVGDGQGIWRIATPMVTKSRTRLSNFHFHLSTQPVIPGIHPEHQLITEFYSLYLLDTSDLSHSIQPHHHCLSWLPHFLVARWLELLPEWSPSLPTTPHFFATREVFLMFTMLLFCLQAFNNCLFPKESLG